MPIFWPNLVIGDEASFQINACVSSQNDLEYAPRGYPPMNTNYHRPDSRQKWTVWVGLCYNGEVVGPLFFPGNVNGEAYLDMLNNNVVPILSQHYEVQANRAFRRVWWAQDLLIVELLFVTGYRNFSETESLPLDNQENGLLGLLILPLATFFCGGISRVPNTSTEFGGPPQQNHCRSAFTAAGHGSPSCAEYGNSCSLMHRTKWPTHRRTISLLTFYAIARCVIN